MMQACIWGLIDQLSTQDGTHAHSSAACSTQWCYQVVANGRMHRTTRKYTRRVCLSQSVWPELSQICVVMVFNRTEPALSRQVQKYTDAARCLATALAALLNIP